MHIGLIGLGKMGQGLASRIINGGGKCTAYDNSDSACKAAASLGVKTVSKLEELVENLKVPRTIWLMLPHEHLDAVILELIPLLEAGDTLIDGGNSYYKQSIHRATQLEEADMHFIDVGTSGGIEGKKKGYCLMIGGDRHIVEDHETLFAILAGVRVSSSDRSTETTPQTGDFLYCGRHGAGHFVKMVHNGIEYGLMAAYAEGFGLLDAAQNTENRLPNSNVKLVANPGDIAELWRHGSIIRSMLLDLAAKGYQQDPELSNSSEKVSDSGEGRWALQTATELGVPANILAGALFDRFRSQGKASQGDRLQSSMRYLFGGHDE